MFLLRDFPPQIKEDGPVNYWAEHLHPGNILRLLRLSGH
jgi:hypothetical protein